MTTSPVAYPFYRRRWFVPVVVLAALAIGYFLGGGGSGGDLARVSEEATQSKVRFWTCSMHPQIRQPESGLCPICAMDLIPVYDEDSGGKGGPRSLTLSETARNLAGIQVATVERRSPEVEIRMAGKVEVDETRLGTITARMPGRIDRLWVDYTGVQVREGDSMVDLYSPELISAQEELLQVAAAGSAGSDPGGMMDGVREKLRLWGVSGDQIDEILRRGTPSEHLTLRSPMSGVVLDRHATTGMYVTTGMRIYTIADLSHVWVTLDAYESDLVWIREGQEVRFEVEAYPGESFEGQVAFVDPVVNTHTRTVRVRVEAANPDSRLKPEMFVRAVLHAGMPEEADGPPLVVPATAPLITGKRAVVYVQSPGDGGTFDGREVVLGPRAGEHYVVADGLYEGEIVVVNGAFKIDSALQILAKPSMMNPEGGAAPAGHHHGAHPVADEMESEEPSHAGHAHE